MAVLEIIAAVLTLMFTALISYSFWIEDSNPEKAEKYKTIGTCLVTLMALIFLIAYLI